MFYTRIWVPRTPCDINRFRFSQPGYLALTHCRFFVLDEADGLLKAGYGELIERLHRQIPKITSDGRRLQMVVCSATLHAFEVKKMAVSTKLRQCNLRAHAMIKFILWLKFEEFPLKDETKQSSDDPRSHLMDLEYLHEMIGHFFIIY